MTKAGRPVSAPQVSGAVAQFGQARDRSQRFRSVGPHRTPRTPIPEVVPNSFAIAVPASFPLGVAPLLAGWYDSLNQQRLAVMAGAQPLNDNRIMIGSVEIIAP